MSSLNPWMAMILVIVVLLYAARAVWRAYKEVKDLHFNYSMRIYSWPSILLLGFALTFCTLVQLLMSLYVLAHVLGGDSKP